MWSIFECESWNTRIVINRLYVRETEMTFFLGSSLLYDQDHFHVNDCWAALRPPVSLNNKGWYAVVTIFWQHKNSDKTLFSLKLHWRTTIFMIAQEWLCLLTTPKQGWKPKPWLKIYTWQIFPQKTWKYSGIPDDCLPEIKEEMRLQFWTHSRLLQKCLLTL